MPDYPTFDFSNNELIRVGKALTQPIPFETEAERVEAIRLFQIAYNYRDGHAYPMRRMKHELIGNVRKTKSDGITSARMKRMSSIRRKLSRGTTKFNQIQDIGGCRAIVSTIAGVDRLISAYRSGSTTHTIRTDTSYIESPRPSGYRGHHLVLQFRASASGEEKFEARRIELQFRTRLQHAWATAVEAVGAIRREELKAGEGNRDWLRFFALISSQFAIDEDCPTVPGTPEAEFERHAEIADLNSKLGAIQYLDNINNAFDIVDSISDRNAKFFLIQFDQENRAVTVRGFGQISTAAGAYSSEERDRDKLNTVLVEVDAAGNLREAYPNYFLDVSTFTDRVRSVLKLEGPRSVQPRYAQDLSWLKAYKSR